MSVHTVGVEPYGSSGRGVRICELAGIGRQWPTRPACGRPSSSAAPRQSN